MARPMAKPSYVGVKDLTAEVLALAVDSAYVPFGAACPDHTLFPTKKLARILAAVGRNDPALLGRYAMSWAYDPLAREVARRYLQAGCPLSHDELVITVGCTEAINLALRAVTKPGDTVAVETPSYFGFLDTIQSLNLQVLEIPTGARSVNTAVFCPGRSTAGLAVTPSGRPSTRSGPDRRPSASRRLATVEDASSTSSRPL